MNFISAALRTRKSEKVWKFMRNSRRSRGGHSPCIRWETASPKTLISCSREDQEAGKSPPPQQLQTHILYIAIEDAEHSINQKCERENEKRNFYSLASHFRWNSWETFFCALLLSPSSTSELQRSFLVVLSGYWSCKSRIVWVEFSEVFFAASKFLMNFLSTESFSGGGGSLPLFLIEQITNGSRIVFFRMIARVTDLETECRTLIRIFSVWCPPSAATDEKPEAINHCLVPWEVTWVTLNDFFHLVTTNDIEHDDYLDDRREGWRDGGRI